MHRVRLVDTTIRDGQQSLWATRMTNEMIFPVLAQLDEMGYDVIDVLGGAMFDVCVRYLREDPWDRLRQAAQIVRKTPMNVFTRGQSLFTFEMFPDDVVELAIRRIAATGVRRYTCYDSLHDIRNMALSVRVTKESGMESVGHVVYTESPVHTDAYYAAKMKEIVALGVDVFGIKDPGGLLTVERARTLVPAVRAVAPNLPFELHTHCRGSVGELVALTSVPFGVDYLYTGIRPLASADALPDGRYCARRLREMGYDVRVADADFERMEKYLTDLAHRYGKPIVPPNRYDPFLYKHQVPGGMISNLRSQLRDLGMEDRLDEVMAEAAVVREDLGYPVIVSPFAQFTITQAAINVVSGKRYGVIPDEVVRYVQGYYGKPAGPIAPEVLQRVAEITGGAEPITARPGEVIPPRLEETRAARGPFKSDDDLLLAVFYQPAQLEPLYERHGNVAPANGTSLRDALKMLEGSPPRRPIQIRTPELVMEGSR
jgi:oxaloacetate decarboxylase alpha subunit